MGFNHEHVDLPNEMSVALGTCCCFNNFIPWSLILLVKYTTASGKKERISPTKNCYDEMWINRCSKHAPGGVTTFFFSSWSWCRMIFPREDPSQKCDKGSHQLENHVCIYMYIYIIIIYIYIYYRYVWHEWPLSHQFSKITRWKHLLRFFATFLTMARWVSWPIQGGPPVPSLAKLV